MSAPEIWKQIEAQLRAVADGQEGAWDTLLTALSPELLFLARNQPIGRLKNDEDAQRDIVTRVIAKLHKDEHAVVKKFASAVQPPKTKAWIRVLTRSAAIDMMRGRPEFLRGNNENLPGWVSLATLVTRNGVVADNSLVGKRREVEAFMTRALALARKAISVHGDDAAETLASELNLLVLHTRRLVSHIDSYPTIFEMLLAGHSYVDIAKSLNLSRRAVELQVGYIEELFHARGFAA